MEGGLINPERLARDVVVVGASAGGFQLLMQLVGALEPGLPAGVALVLHRSPDVGGSLLELLQRRARLPVVEPRSGDPFAHGTVYLASRGRHLVFLHRAFWLSDAPKENHVRPAVDPLFRSAAHDFGPRVLGVVLSGGDSDGARGCRAISEAGGLALVQDPGQAQNPSMPNRTIQLDHVSAVLPMDRILDAIPALAAGQAFPRGGSGADPAGAAQRS